MDKVINDNQGSSLVELVIAMALFSLLISTLFVFSFSGITNLERSKYYAQALSYLEEAEEIVNYLAEEDFASLNDYSGGLIDTGKTWALLGGGTTETIGNFTRTVNFSNVYRDANGRVVYVGGEEDNTSQFADIEVEWLVEGQREINLQRRVIVYDI